MTLVAKNRPIAAKSKFRVELDNISEIRATVASSLKITFNIIDTEEGGAPTTAENTVNGYKFEPISIERPLTDNDDFANWVENFKAGQQDKRNGAIYALSANGLDLCRWDLKEVFIADYEEFQGDGKAKEEAMMERITLRYRERGKRVRLQ